MKEMFKLSVACAQSFSWGGGFGFFIKIQHKGGYATLYAHCSRISVRSGQEVVQGEAIGFVGTTGRSIGYHLHWEIHRNGVRVDSPCFFVFSTRTNNLRILSLNFSFRYSYYLFYAKTLLVVRGLLIPCPLYLRRIAPPSTFALHFQVY